ncbi:reverse-transcriptase domain containing protein,putative [Babesia caballi]|uniref:Reverse-transcriptase domain containing protein,putative n=1 Tax=Babesia caballi TaxID=5871 RepID=A0AAV4LRI9_BABCB|nr:reverse-transcriptase domain containing protein,putative [Babesia caballi]
MLLDTDLSAKNLFRAVNQYALTVPNYYIGVVPMEPHQFAKLHRMVRKQLYEKGAHKHCADISRLYLPHPDIIVADTQEPHHHSRDRDHLPEQLDLGKQMKFQTFGNHDTEIIIIPWVMTYHFLLRELGVAAVEPLRVAKCRIMYSTVDTDRALRLRDHGSYITTNTLHH